MYITPDSTIYLYKGIPLDNTYQDTMYFANLQEQLAAFEAFRPQRIYIPRNTYSRVNKNTVRVEMPYSRVYNVNYMMFNNNPHSAPDNPYENKWWFAFITKINYINDNTAELEFEIDVMQTWAFDYTLEPSFVEREHSATDNFGEHLLPEPVDTSVMKCNTMTYPDWFDEFAVLVAVAENTGG